MKEIHARLQLPLYGQLDQASKDSGYSKNTLIVMALREMFKTWKWEDKEQKK